MKVKVTADAEAAIDFLDDWWREQRPAARLAVVQEVKRIIELLRDNPGLGTLYEPEEFENVRRYRLRTTPYYLYYQVDEPNDELIVIGVWSAVRGVGPEF